MKKISLLGSTGSIGTQSLDVCEMHGYDVKCLTANSRVDIMEEQVRKFKPDMVCMMSEAAAKELKSKISDTNTKVVCGMDGLIECATYDKADTVLNSVVGMVGLQPTLETIKAKKTLALANKETLVAGGHLVTNLAKENAVQILSHIPAFFRKFLISAVDMRLKRSRRNRRNIIHNAVGNFFRIINNKFSCSVPCPSEIIKHFTCGFKIKRGLIIRIVKAL
jgi:hypothetical protein